jgi:pantetheine-phosphate adenylyltransferase
VYPGSFDPLTLGHLDVIARGAQLFDEVTVAILVNASKQPFLSLEQRLEMTRECVEAFGNVKVDTFDGLLVDFCRHTDAQFVLRGLRSASDYEYEQPMASANRVLLPGLDVVFLMSKPELAYISSRMVREIHLLGGDVSHLVPPQTAQRLKLK